jgi:hypothetical protein
LQQLFTFFWQQPFAVILQQPLTVISKQPLLNLMILNSRRLSFFFCHLYLSQRRLLETIKTGLHQFQRLHTEDRFCQKRSRDISQKDWKVVCTIGTQSIKKSFKETEIVKSSQDEKI